MPPVVPHPTAYLGAGEAVSAGVEGGTGEEKVGLKSIECVSNRSQRVFFLFVKVIVAAGQGCVLDPAILQRVFDHSACAHGARYEEYLLAGLVFAADLGKKLIQIVEHLHIGVSLILINRPKSAGAHLAVGAEKYRRVEKKGQPRIVGRL